MPLARTVSNHISWHKRRMFEFSVMTQMFTDAWDAPF